MKRNNGIIAATMAVLLSVSLTACGGDTADDGEWVKVTPLEEQEPVTDNLEACTRLLGDDMGTLSDMAQLLNEIRDEPTDEQIDGMLDMYDRFEDAKAYAEPGLALIMEELEEPFADFHDLYMGVGGTLELDMTDTAMDTTSLMSACVGAGYQASEQ